MRSAYAPWPTARSPHPYAPRRGGWQPVDEVSYHRAHHGHAYGAYPTGGTEVTTKGVSWVSIDSPNDRERRAASQCGPPAPARRAKRADPYGPSYAAAPQGARSLSAVPVSAAGPMSARETQAVQHLLDENDSLYRELAAHSQPPAVGWPLPASAPPPPPPPPASHATRLPHRSRALPHRPTRSNALDEDAFEMSARCPRDPV